jgi:hypothetical protein
MFGKLTLVFYDPWEKGSPDCFAACFEDESEYLSSTVFE